MREDSFLEEASNPGEKVDSCPKESNPQTQVLLRDYTEKKTKGLHAEERILDA